MDGEEITIKGQMSSGDIVRLDLFDGLFTTGYRLTSFTIAPQEPVSGFEFVAKLLTQEPAGSTSVWNWDNNLEVGWAGFNIPTNTRFGEYSRVDMDMSIIEDLYIDMAGSGGAKANYMITMRKVTFPIGIGAMNMVRNMSQGPVP